MPTITLKPGREKSVRNRHPWLFSGAIQRIDSDALDGEIVDAHSHAGQWLARGYLNRRSRIQVRLLSWDAGQAIDEDFWRRRLQQASAGRAALAADAQTNAYRLVHAESDGLPGLVVDRYGDWLVVQTLTLGIERVKPLLARLLVELCQPTGIVERSDVDVRTKEGLRPAVGMLHGQTPAGLVEILEHGQRFLVDLLGGQKTGFYLDQRENRRRTAAYCQAARVLNAFSYSGGFAVYALAGGAQHVVNLDSSIDALELGERNLALNGYDPDIQSEGVAGDVFQVVPSQRLSADLGVHPFAVYRALRTINPSPYLGYLDLGPVTLVASSPESLVRAEGRRVETRPIAGTRRRGATAAEDDALAVELAADPKERAEHVMLVDLGRNDLGRVCRAGSVRVSDLMSVERYSHVMHLVSRVEGELADGLTPLDALAATLPMGTASGAPKVRAMEIIDELEPVRRGPYAGAFGYVAVGGDMDMALTLRTMVVAGGRLHLQAGGGVVADSDPELEYQESLNKLAALRRAVEAASEGLA